MSKECELCYGRGRRGMTNLLGMLRKAVEATGKEVSFPADEAEMAIIAAIRAVNASHEREVAENGYKNILVLYQETYQQLEAARAEARALRAELAQREGE